MSASSPWRATRRRRATSISSRSATTSITSRELRHIAPTSGLVYIDGDTSMSPGTWEAVMRGVGGAVAATEAVMTGKHANAFVAVRPPGHHAETSTSRWASASSTMPRSPRATPSANTASRRAAVVDFDVHHGNGTQDIFWADKTVMYCSTHQMPLFPGTGARGERGEHDTIVNAPLAPEDGGAQFRAAFENAILPQLEKFAPELVIISAGFDAHHRDPLASINLDAEDFAWVTRKLMDVADAAAGGRVVSVLEGGYDLQGLKESVAAHVTALMGADDRNLGRHNAPAVQPFLRSPARQRAGFGKPAWPKTPKSTSRSSPSSARSRNSKRS